MAKFNVSVLVDVEARNSASAIETVKGMLKNLPVTVQNATQHDLSGVEISDSLAAHMDQQVEENDSDFPSDLIDLNYISAGLEGVSKLKRLKKELDALISQVGGSTTVADLLAAR